MQYNLATVLMMKAAEEDEENTHSTDSDVDNTQEIRELLTELIELYSNTSEDPRLTRIASNAASMMNNFKER